MEGFEEVDDLIYKNDNFFELEIPTIKIGKFNLPISGGGYLRLFPYSIISLLLKEYSKKHNNFLLYVHPFELTDISLLFPKNISLKDRFRASVGRKGNLRKLEKVLVMLIKDGAEFKQIGQVVSSLADCEEY